MLLRRLRADRGIVLLIVVLVGATSFVFAAAPRLVNRAADDGLRHAMDLAPASQRNISMRQDASLEPDADGGVDGIRDYGGSLAARMPDSITALVADHGLSVTTIRFLLPDPPAFETHLSLRYQDGLMDEARIVEGRWPEDLGLPLEERVLGGPDDPQGSPEPARFEVAFSKSQATQLGVKLGDRYALALDTSDPLIRATAFRIGPADVEVVGLFEPIDDAAPYWSGNEALLVAEQRGDPDSPIAFAYAAIPAASYVNLRGTDLPFHYEWRFQVDPARVDADQVATLQADLPKLDRLSSTATGILVTTGLRPILERHAAERALAESALSIAALGPFGLATAALTIVAILLVRRRVPTIALVRGRGASGALVLGTQLWEAILITGGAALVGLGLAIAAIPARDSPLSAVLAVAVAVTATLLLVGASWTAARRSLGQPSRDDARVLRVPPRRLVLEGTVVAIAVGATFLLRQRGLAVTADGTPRADPLLASVPVLSGLAAGIVALRLYPVPIRALGWVAAGRRDLVPVLGLRTIGRRSGAANLPLLAILLAAAFAAFTSVLAASLDRGQLVESYERVGADYRLERIGASPMTTIDGLAIPGIEATAIGLIDAGGSFAGTPSQRAPMWIAAVDPGPYAAVTAGTPADPRWPAAFLQEPSPDGLGTEANPIPAILSTNLPGGSEDLRPGAVFMMSVIGQPMRFQLVERRPDFPGVDRNIFAIVPYNMVRIAAENGRLPVDRVWLRGSADAGAALATAVEDGVGEARIIARPTVQAGLRDSPMGQAVVSGYGLAVAVAAAYLALTIVGALILSAARRTRDLAYLRTLGVSAPQSLGLTVMEHAPPVLLALVPGVALGILVAALTLPGLGLGTFAGSSGAVPMFVDVPSLVWLIAALVAVVAVAVTLGTWLSRRARLVNALRMTED